MIEKIKNYSSNIWANKKKRCIIISIAVLIILLIIIIAIAVGVSRKKYSNELCKKPYEIKVYSDSKLKSAIKKCGYKEDSDLFDFVLNVTKRHNDYRACHNAEPLLPNCELMEISQSYAETMPSDHSGSEFHGEWMGENLYWIWNGYPTGYDPVDAWYSEISDYDFNTHSSIGGKKVGHFTQLVWKNSKEIGVGYYCNNNQCCVVSNYYPGGNYNNDNVNQVQDLK